MRETRFLGNSDLILLRREVAAAEISGEVRGSTRLRGPVPVVFATICAATCYKAVVTVFFGTEGLLGQNTLGHAHLLTGKPERHIPGLHTNAAIISKSTRNTAQYFFSQLGGDSKTSRRR